MPLVAAYCKEKYNCDFFGGDFLDNWRKHYGINFVMICSECFKHFYSGWLTSCKHFLNLSQKNTKHCKKKKKRSLFSEKILKYQKISTVVGVCRTCCRRCKMQPQYENMHTREQSVPFFCSHYQCPTPPLPEHTVYVKGLRKHSICQCTNLHNEQQRKNNRYIYYIHTHTS